MKKYTLKEKLQYKFDNLMDQGTITLVGMLFVITIIVIIVASTALVAIDDAHALLGPNIWAGIVHVLDGGAIAEAETSNMTYLIIMSIVTLCGIFITSILIGIITTGFEEKLNALKKGNSHVVEKKHTIILGFDNNTYTLLSELIIANENKKDACVVILTETDKEEVEERIQNEIKDFKTTRVICRTGNIIDTYMLEKCGIENCSSVIINARKDFDTIKAILTIRHYFGECERNENLPNIVATICEVENYEAAMIASKGIAEIILVKDTVARIVAQTCRQSGLPNVLMELFDYDGDELYFEHFPELAGETFGSILNRFESAVVFGYRRGTEVIINPDNECVLEEHDDLILLVEDDGKACISDYIEQGVGELNVFEETDSIDKSVLVIGMNDMVREIIFELDEYYENGSNVILANNTIDTEVYELQKEMKHIKLSFVECDINARVELDKLTQDEIAQVLLLSDKNTDEETADSKTLLRLLHLRDIVAKTGKEFNITSEINNTSNAKLAKVTKANDLVIGSDIVNLILTQVSENRELAIVFKELLRTQGTEIYIRRANLYVQTNVETDFYNITAILRERNEVAIGYKIQGDESFEIIVNPRKSDKITLTDRDSIICLARD